VTPVSKVPRPPAVGRRLFGDAAASPPRPDRDDTPPASARAAGDEPPPSRVPEARQNERLPEADVPTPAHGLAHAPSQTARAAVPSPRSGPGRPPVHEEPTEKTTVILRRSNVVYLDRTSAEVRATSGTSLRRSEILRALVDALQESRLDITGVGSEGELRGLLVGHLSRAWP